MRKWMFVCLGGLLLISMGSMVQQARRKKASSSQ